ncbi:hypothetical protein ACIU1J_25975 [Azospirillum doebereinerae]|uniref:hypothetical protein n=1 Tax=Azospirillum doebereinerae TaxID=92933 RepID=UPI001EE5BF53|nr:hypothetical protein [Azospirillum doebereinerae]MCG5241327.1 hypothetical protein [Azospirillum doebereinerae]
MSGMVRTPIAETTLTGLRPTGVAGSRVLDSWEQIDSYLRSAQAGDVADLFAEPVMQPGGRITWFANDGASARRFADLPPDQQKALREALRDRMTRLEIETARLLGSTNPTARLIGETLQRAQQVPGPVEDVLFSVDGQPVIINWSTEPEGAPPPRDPLKEFVRRAEAAKPLAPKLPPVPQPIPEAPVVSPPLNTVAPAVERIVVVKTFPWWSLLWLLFALLAAAIFYVLMIGCGLWPGGRGLDYCPVPPVAAVPVPDTEAVRTDALRAELAALEQRLDQAPRCAPPTQRAESTEFERRIAASGAAEGELTITLIWNTPSDLDLHVHCPTAGRISFNNRTACGGTLDVDANSGRPHPEGKPVENVFFPAGAAEAGVYRIEVHNYKHRGTDADRFQVRVKKGTEVTVRDGEVTPDGIARVIDVQLP